MGLSRKFGKQGLHILGMSLDEGGEKILKEFIITNKLTYPVALVDDDLTSAYGIRSLPAMVVISKKGVVAERFQGFNDDVARNMDSLIKKLLAE